MCAAVSTAPDQSVHNLLQLLSESGATGQKDLPAWLLMFLHSCQDATGRVQMLSQNPDVYQLYAKEKPDYYW